MSKAMRKITGSLAMSKCTVIFLNQLRSKVGVIYGSPEVTSGGNALKFYASVRLDSRRKEVLPDNAGIRVKVKVVKNKVAAPFKTAMLDIIFGEGIDQMGSLIDAALELGVVERKGSWYAFKGINFAQGRYKAAGHMKQNADFADEISVAVNIALSAEGNVDQDATEQTEVEEEEDVSVFEETSLGEME
jgi:recombination protein RecA